MLSVSFAVVSLWLLLTAPEVVSGSTIHSEILSPPEWKEVSQVYVVSIPSFSERLRYMSQKLGSMGIKFETIQAVESKDLVPTKLVHPALIDNRISESININKYKNLTYHSKNVQAIMISHMYTIVRAMDDIGNKKIKDGPVLIIEDTVQFRSKIFKAEVSKLLTMLNNNLSDWDMFAVGSSRVHPLKTDPILLKSKTLTELFIRSLKHHDAHCYVVNGATFIIILFFHFILL